MQHSCCASSCAPYESENRRARELYIEVETAQNIRQQKIEEAKIAALAGDLRKAVALLASLPQRDQNSSEVKESIRDILASDKTPPAAENTTDENRDPNRPITISARVNDNLAVKEVRLYYRKKDQQEYEPVKMMKSNEEGVYTFGIPSGYHGGKKVHYYIIAIDANGNSKPLGSAEEPLKIEFSIPINPPPVP
jgi:hypothetical protein